MRFFLAVVILLISGNLFGYQQTFLLQDIKNNRLLVHEGDPAMRLSPYSTFKIPISLMGFDSLILENSEQPLWPYREEYKSWNDFFLDKWEAAHHPLSWMQNSCVWFSQVLTQKLGREKFAKYVNALAYGNQNLQGDPGKENGLTHAWLGSSLRITCSEQLDLLTKLIKQELPFSTHAHLMTKSILFLEQLPNGMNLYGKTGGGFHAFGQESDVKISWFIGWIEKQDLRLAFVFERHGQDSSNVINSLLAKEEVKARLLQLAL